MTGVPGYDDAVDTIPQESKIGHAQQAHDGGDVQETEDAVGDQQALGLGEEECSFVFVFPSLDTRTPNRSGQKNKQRHMELVDVFRKDPELGCLIHWGERAIGSMHPGSVSQNHQQNGDHFCHVIYPGAVQCFIHIDVLIHGHQGPNDGGSWNVSGRRSHRSSRIDVWGAVGDNGG